MDQIILKYIGEIDHFNGYWSGSRVLSEPVLETMKRFATIESIGSSTRIEGSKLSDEEVESLLENLNTTSFRNRDEEEVAGYAEVLKLIYDSYPEMKISESVIKGLHNQLLLHSEKDEWHRGEYKKQPNHVAAFDEDGRQIGIVFETTSPFETPFEMESIVKDFQKSFEENKEHVLIIIGRFIVRFLAIHPFQDGNGRLARELTNLLLIQSGYSYVQYSSLERVVEANKEEYYRALRKSQKTIGKKEENLDVWLAFFLKMLIKQKQLLIEAIDREESKLSLKLIDKQIIEVFRSNRRATISEITAATKINRNVAKVHLRSLVADGVLNQHGGGRGTYYTLS